MWETVVITLVGAFFLFGLGLYSTHSSKPPHGKIERSVDPEIDKNNRPNPEAMKMASAGTTKQEQPLANAGR